MHTCEVCFARAATSCEPMASREVTSMILPCDACTSARGLRLPTIWQRPASFWTCSIMSNLNMQIQLCCMWQVDYTTAYMHCNLSCTLCNCCAHLLQGGRCCEVYVFGDLVKQQVSHSSSHNKNIMAYTQGPDVCQLDCACLTSACGNVYLPV